MESYTQRLKQANGARAACCVLRVTRRDGARNTQPAAELICLPCALGGAVTNILKIELQPPLALPLVDLNLKDHVDSAAFP